MHTQTDRQTDRHTDLAVELTSPFGRGQLKILHVIVLADQAVFSVLISVNVKAKNSILFVPIFSLDMLIAILVKKII